MRIVAGKFGGRQLVSPKTRDTRPMTDKTRGALFSILGDIEGFNVLDAYAGSGALGFEALSRGAQTATAIEMGRQAIKAITANSESLDVSFSYQLAPVSVESWLARRLSERFDLIFAMPPYAVLDREILARLARLLNKDGIMVVEYPRQVLDYEIEGLSLVDTRQYGDPTLCFYRAT